MSKTTGELRNDYQKIKEVVTQDPNITSKEFKKRLQEAGITDINCVYVSSGRRLAGYTLLHYSIHFGDQNSAEYKKIIGLLIGNGADVKLKTVSSCMSSLDSAVTMGNVEVIKMILDTNKPTQQDKINALCFATISGNLKAMDMLIGSGININSLGTNERMSLLSFAIACSDRFGVSQNRLQVIQRLLDRGADPAMKNEKNPYTNEQDEIGTSQYSEKSPLEIAREKGDKEIIKLLESPREIDDSIAILESSLESSESKYKESRQIFLASLGKDGFGVIATGLLITAAMIAQPVFVTVASGILAALAVTLTLLHVKDFTLPSYRKMKETQAESLGEHSKSEVVVLGT